MVYRFKFRGGSNAIYRMQATSLIDKSAGFVVFHKLLINLP